MSNEWLTTGQMIEALKNGQFAKNQWDCKVTKDEHSSILQVIDVDGIGDRYEFLPLKSEFVNCKWRIIPNFVSFEETMKALKEGKTVEFHPTIKANRKIFLSPTMLDDILDDLLVSQYSLKELLNGQWTIEADTNA